MQQQQEQFLAILSNQFPPAVKMDTRSAFKSSSCDHNECSKYDRCLLKHKTPSIHGHDEELNMFTFSEIDKLTSSVNKLSLHSEILQTVQEIRMNETKEKHGLGFISARKIPKSRLEENLPQSCYKPSKIEIKKFLGLYKGISPYTASDEWMKKMFSWDIYTHPLAEKYKKELAAVKTERKSYAHKRKQAWLDYMKQNDCWLSFYEFYYCHGIRNWDTPLIIPQFSDKIKNMLYNPRKRLMSKELNTFNLEEDETSSSQTKKHKWTRADGKILTSTFLLPPWDNLKAKEKNDDGSIESTILLSPALQDNK